MLKISIQSYLSLYFLSFGLNTERYAVSLPIQSKCGKIRTTKAPNTDTFCAVEKRVMYSKSDNLKIMINDEADKIIEELFSLLRKRYQNRLEMMKGSEFVFHYIHLFY